MIPWSDEARILARPYAAYAQLHTMSTPTLGACIRRGLAFSIAAGAFTSFTADGSLSLALFLDGAVAWSVIPIVQAGLLVVVLAVIPRCPSRRLALPLFLAGNAPWIAWLLLVAALPLVVAKPPFFLFPHTQSGYLPATFLLAFAWACVVRHAFFHQVVRLSKPAAVLAVLAYSALVALAVCVFLIASGIWQL